LGLWGLGNQIWVLKGQIKWLWGSSFKGRAEAHFEAGTAPTVGVKDLRFGALGIQETKSWF
jgi:hypothetical protein